MVTKYKGARYRRAVENNKVDEYIESREREHRKLLKITGGLTNAGGQAKSTGSARVQRRLKRERAEREGAGRKSIC